MTLSIRTKNILIETIKLLFMILFVYTATSKLIDFEHFEMQLKKSPFISSHADWIIWALPLVEYTIAGLFLFQRHLGLALYSSLFLMTLFTTYIFIVLNFSDDIPCACGGVLESLGWNAHLIFNIAFMALAVIGISLTHKKIVP